MGGSSIRVHSNCIPVGFTLRFFCEQVQQKYCTVQKILGKLPWKHPRLRVIFANVLLGIPPNIFRATVLWNMFGCFWKNNCALPAALLEQRLGELSRTAFCINVWLFPSYFQCFRSLEFRHFKIYIFCWNVIKSATSGSPFIIVKHERYNRAINYWNTVFDCTRIFEVIFVRSWA